MAYWLPENYKQPKEAFAAPGTFIFKRRYRAELRGIKCEVVQ
jgi:hypothetical protein